MGPSESDNAAHLTLMYGHWLHTVNTRTTECEAFGTDLKVIIEVTFSSWAG
jgi:hypothetical protein